MPRSLRLASTCIALTIISFASPSSHATHYSFGILGGGHYGFNGNPSGIAPTAGLQFRRSLNEEWQTGLTALYLPLLNESSFGAWNLLALADLDFRFSGQGYYAGAGLGANWYRQPLQGYSTYHSRALALSLQTGFEMEIRSRLLWTNELRYVFSNDMHAVNGVTGLRYVF